MSPHLIKYEKNIRRRDDYSGSSWLDIHEKQVWLCWS